MHPDLEENENDPQESVTTTLIPADWLQTIKWNKKNCIAMKRTIERDLNHLNKLRNAPGCNGRNIEHNEKIRKQIRIFENKLVRNFSKMIFARRRFDKWDDDDDLHEFSLISKWFNTIGLDDKCKEILSDQYEDIEELLNADEEELKILLMRGFNMKIDELNLDDISFTTNHHYDIDQEESYFSANFDDNQQQNGTITNDNDNNNNNVVEDVQQQNTIKQDLRNYVRDYIKRIWKAQRSMHHCLDSMKNSQELPSNLELYWDSWDHWITRVDESRKASLASAIASLKKAKHSPKPLPPLPDLKTNFLRNYRTNGGGDSSNSRSTGSSPLSPPIPPLSAGNFSHRSTSSSSSSIIQSGFYNLNLIVDPNHVPYSNVSTQQQQQLGGLQHRRPTPPPTPPVSHYQNKKSFVLLSSASIFNTNSNHSNRNSSERKFPTTPPPIRRHQTNIFGGIGENFPLTKSKSHEEHLSNRIEPLDPVINSKLLKKYNLVPLSGKSQSQKNQSNKHNSLDNLPHVPPYHQRRRLATEPGSIGSISPILTSSNCSSPIAISPENQTYYGSEYYNRQSGGVPCAGPIDNCFLDSSVPRSPRSQAMSHSIHHRFVSTMKINSIQCNVCEKQMFFGFKCRDCKYYCHRDCQDKAPNSCGLPSELVDIFKQTLSESQTRSSSPKNQMPQRAKSQMNYYSSQMNSHSSSNPSSPAALFNNHSSSSSATISPTIAGTNINYIGQNNNFSGKSTTSSSSGSQFQFPPDINITSTMSIDYDDSTMIEHLAQSPSSSNSIITCSAIMEDNEIIDSGTMSKQSISTIQEEEEMMMSASMSSSPTMTTTSTIISTATSPSATQSSSQPLVDSDKSTNSVLITSGSSGDSVRTVTGRLDSQDSQASDMDQNDGTGSRGDNGGTWPRQNSVTSREWDIPYDELKIEEEIGTGRFGTVFRGKWHGSVAIKRLNMCQNNVNEEKKAFETFKQEVAIFRKTRHDNLVLFMGACMKPPHLAIVTSLCKGLTLHTHIHVRHDKFNLNRTIMIAEQICLGMGYLHAREIIHKDLKTKNIFYENGKVIITDFGLSSVAKLCVSNRRGDWLTVPKGWLCYLAPEIIRTLSVHSQESDDLPFSFSTDIYAFGTVWFELLFGSWPFSGQPSEVIIWQVGKGIKQPITNFQASKEIKDLLYTCWAYRPEARPDFGKLYEYLEKLPKKRLQRSPSHPAHLQHASEQTFF